MSRTILDYFPKKHCKFYLPDPRGSLSSKILLPTIAAANTKVMHVMNGSSKLKSAGEKRGAYNKYTPEHLIYYQSPGATVHMVTTNRKQLFQF